jgi:DtxR family Mn-dependent transcriptional regulator
VEKRLQLSASVEDYLEKIYITCRESGEARCKDIVDSLGVSAPSVTEALQLLSAKKLVNYAPYLPITLTREGEEVARDVLFRHEALREFFIEVLGVEQDQAEEGACRMEHAVTPGVIERIVQYTRYLREECEGRSCAEIYRFREYLERMQLEKDSDEL